MSKQVKVSVALLFGAMLAGGCGSQAQEKSAAPMEKSKAGLPDAGTAPGTKPPETPAAPPPPDKGKEKRANTPPGKTRAGDGPLDGAIVDPAGVTTK
jgi:hypothetical protein